jgi:hypothetical protein
MRQQLQSISSSRHSSDAGDERLAPPRREPSLPAQRSNPGKGKAPEVAIGMVSAAVPRYIEGSGRPRGQGTLVTDKTRLPLTAYGKDKHGVQRGHITVQGQIAVRTTPDHQFALAVSCRSADQRIGFQYADRFDDFSYACRSLLDFLLGEVIQDAIKILTDLGCQFDLRHSQRTRWRGVGAGSALPARRSSRKARISCQGIVFPEAAMRA